MEVPEMEGGKQPETPRSSAAAFVEGGIQNACDDACSICLEQFCESDPSTVTNCKHEYHLQCILEWCQRSSQCPMCWQAISLKDPNSQELLAAVERERNIRLNPPRNAAVFIHPILGEFELPHLPIGVNDAELEERIIQHLTAAAAMGRAHHFSRRDGHRSRSSAHGRPHLIFSPQSGGPTSVHMSSSLTGAETEPAAISVASPSTPSNSLSSGGHEASQQVLQFSPVQADRNSSTSRSTVIPTNRSGFSFTDRSTSSPSSLTNQDRAGPSDLQSFSESLKSRFNAASLRYKESISKSTRGWKERLFSRNSSMSSLGSEIRAEVNAGIASVSRMVEQLDTRDNSRASQASVSNQNNQNTSESHG